MKRTIAVLPILLVLTAAVSFLLSAGPPRGQEKREFATYEEMREHLGGLFKDKKYAEAAALLERSLERFPDRVLPNTYNLAMARLRQGDADRALAALEEGHRRGVFYGLWDFAAEAWEPVRARPRFSAFLERNRLRIAEAQKSAAMRLEVATPEGFDPSRTYPLFIALHGGGESVADFRPAWTSPRLRKEFLTAYVQSSQVATMSGFHWQDAEATRRDLAAALERVVGQYPVDAGRVVVGGFSSGGFGSLLAALRGFFEVRGFVVLCPEVPADLDEGDLRAAGSRGLRGVLLTTEADRRVEQQRALIARLERAGLAVRFHLTPGLGHWYPADFQARLDEAVEFVLDQARTPGADAAGSAAILAAAEGGDLDAVTRLLEKDPRLAEARNADGDTVLHQAAGGRRGEEAALSIVRLVLAGGAEPETLNASGQSPLLYAAYAGYGRVVELLVGKGAAVDRRDTHGRTPLHYAAREGRARAVEVLLGSGADPFVKDGQGRTPLEYAVLQNRAAVLESLIKLVSYDIKGPDGSMLLHAAASQGHEETVRSLLERGADPGRPSPAGETALISYLKGGLGARALAAIADGADVGVRDASGRTALHLAVEKGLGETVPVLLEKGADPSAADRDGRMPLDLAREWFYSSIAALLESKGAPAARPKVHLLKAGKYEIADPPAGPRTATAVVRYLGTDGFLIEAGAKCVLVDGLVDNPWGYTNTPRRALDLMKTDGSPFGRLDLLLFSHAHRDHFEPAMALAVLAAQPRAALVGDRVVAGELRDAGPEAASALGQRLRVPAAGLGERADIEVNGVPLTVLGVNHASADRPYLTLGYIMRLGRFTIYHQGDLFPDANLAFLDSIAWEKERIDIAFFDPFFLQNEAARRMVLERIRPSAVVLMHMRESEAEGYLSQARQSVPQVLAFGRPMEAKVFVKAD